MISDDDVCKYAIMRFEVSDGMLFVYEALMPTFFTDPADYPLLHDLTDLS